MRLSRRVPALLQVKAWVAASAMQAAPAQLKPRQQTQQLLGLALPLAAQQVQANAFLDVYILAQQQFADACKRVRVQVETAFDWDKVENVCMAQDVEPDAKAIEGVPSSELEVRDLRSKCAEQEELITGLLESIEKLSSLREYTPADREAE